MHIPAFGDRARLMPVSVTSTVGEMPRSIIREAKAWRSEWKVTLSMLDFAAAASKPETGGVAVLERLTVASCD